MPRASFVTILATLGAATACDLDRPTAPPAPAAPARPEAEVVTSLATLLSKTTVDDPGDVGLFTSLVSSSDGTQRVAYYDNTNHRLKYAACASNCAAAANWQRGVIDQSADVGQYPSLSVRSGVRHVVYSDVSTASLKYARCSSDCFLQGSWAKGVVAAASYAKQSASLAISPQSGRLYVSYTVDVSGGIGALVYATCLSGCTSTANWQRVRVEQFGVRSGSYTSIAVDADGRRHITYSVGQLKYATCAASCTDPANWERVVADPAANAGRYSSLAVDANRVRHVSHYDWNNQDLRYARCASNCANSAGWARVLVDKGAGTSGSNVGEYTSLAVGDDGGVHVSYWDRTGGRLKYASCARSGCSLTAGWSRQYVDGGCTLLGCTNPANVGGFTSLKLGGGKVHISYYNFTRGDLKYAELTQ